MSVSDISATLSDEEMLARLAACDLSAAERVHERLMAAETAGDIPELGRTYQRIARSLRQTLALKARLEREAALAASDGAMNAAKPPPPGGLAVARRIRDVREAVLRVIWDEAEGEEAQDYEDALEGRLAVESLGDDFRRETLDDNVARLCLRLELSPEGRGLARPARSAGRSAGRAPRPAELSLTAELPPGIQQNLSPVSLAGARRLANVRAPNRGFLDA